MQRARLGAYNYDEVVGFAPAAARRVAATISRAVISILAYPCGETGEV